MKHLLILLAEDNRGDVFLIRQALTEHRIPHELRVVQDGAEAIGYISRMGDSGSEPYPDLMLLDLNLPKIDGSQVLDALRQREECANIPVIVVTSSDAPGDRARVTKLGISHYFRKPLDLAAFMRLGAVIKDVLTAQ